MDNSELYEAALDAITKLFSGTSVSTYQCRENLEALQGEIDVMLAALDEK